MNHKEYSYIITNTLASSGGKSIFELKFRNGITMSGTNLSSTPTLYYVKKGVFLCSIRESNMFTEGDTFTLEPGQSYIITSMEASVLLEFESSVPEFHKVQGHPFMSQEYCNQPTKLWVQRRPEPFLERRAFKMR